MGQFTQGLWRPFWSEGTSRISFRVAMAKIQKKEKIIKTPTGKSMSEIVAQAIKRKKKRPRGIRKRYLIPDICEATYEFSFQTSWKN